MNCHQQREFVVLCNDDDDLRYVGEYKCKNEYVCVCEKAKEILVKMKKHFAFFFFFSVVVDVVKYLKERVDRKKKRKKAKK